MLDHNVFESAALLAKALEKLETKRRDKLARIDDWAAEERKRLLSAADPEARRLVEQADADSHEWGDLDALRARVRPEREPGDD